MIDRTLARAGQKKVVLLTRWSHYRGGRIIEEVVRRGSL